MLRIANSDICRKQIQKLCNNVIDLMEILLIDMYKEKMKILLRKLVSVEKNHASEFDTIDKF